MLNTAQIGCPDAYRVATATDAWCGGAGGVGGGGCGGRGVWGGCVGPLGKATTLEPKNFIFGSNEDRLRVRHFRPEQGQGRRLPTAMGGWGCGGRGCGGRGVGGWFGGGVGATSHRGVRNETTKPRSH